MVQPWVEVVREMSAHGDKVLACSLNYEGSILATVGRERDLFLWETASGKLKKMAGHEDAIVDVRFCHARNTLLASCSLDKTLRVWDLSQSALCALLTLPPGTAASFSSVDFHPLQPGLLATTRTDGLVSLWSYAAPQEKGRVHEGQHLADLPGGMRQARFAPRTEGGRTTLVAAHEGKVNVFEVAEASLTLAQTLSGHERPVQSLAWDREGRHLVSCSEDLVCLWDLRQALPFRQYQAPQQRFYCAAFHPAQSQRLLIGGYQQLHAWDFLHEQLPPSVRSAKVHDGIVSAMATSSQPDQLATVSHDCKVRLWSAR